MHYKGFIYCKCGCSCDHHYRRAEGVLFQLHEYEIVMIIDLLFFLCVFFSQSILGLRADNNAILAGNTCSNHEYIMFYSNGYLFTEDMVIPINHTM